MAASSAAGGAGKAFAPGDDDLYEIRIFGTADRLHEVLRSFPLDIGCSHPHFERLDADTYALLAFATRPQVRDLGSAGCKIEIGENVSQRAEALKGEIGTGDRFDGGRIVPRGYGLKGERAGGSYEDPEH